MKKILLFMVAVLLVFGMVSCDQEVKAKTYKVTYNANGAIGNVPAAIEIEEGGTTIVPSCGSLSMKGYDFVGWNTKKDGRGSAYRESQSLKVDGDIILYAQWSIHEYSISYELDGGSYPEGRSNPKTYTIETENFTLNDPEKDGYEFLGWKTSEGEEPNKNVSIFKGTTGDLAFMAVWRPAFSIIYDANGGEGYVDRTYKQKGESVEVPQASGISREGYSFVCWNTSMDGSGTDYKPGDSYKEDVDIRLYAKWTAVKYTISYDLAGGTMPDGKSNPTEYTIESDTFFLLNPERKGYSFVGWKASDSSDETAEENLSIAKGSFGNKSFTAVWESLPKYIIKFYANGADGGTPPSRLSVYENSSFTVPSCGSLYKDGYFFHGWNTDSNGAGTTYMESESVEVGDDVALYAIWMESPLEFIYLSDSDSYSVTCKDKNVSSIVIPPIYNGKSVTSIGATAFSDCSGLAEITIPVSVVNIEKGAFDGHSGLSIVFAKGVKEIPDGALCDALGVVSVTIPEGVKAIGSSAFKGCSSLTEVTIPEGVTSIYGSAFEGCSGLTEITIPSSVTDMREDVFKDCRNLSVVFAEGIQKIPDNTLCNASGVVSVTIPEGVKAIGYSAFKGCSSLTEVTIPEGVTSIDGSAFEGCVSLTRISIPEGVTVIGSRAFSGCSGLSEITIPSSVTGIGESAFSDINNLSIVFAEGSTRIPGGRNSFGWGGSGIISITIPEGVTEIGDEAFTNCSGLTEITIPSSVKYIGVFAFFGCKDLSIVFAEGTTKIPSAGYGNCWGSSGIISITIPEGVVSIEKEAFKNCKGLTELTIPSSVTSIGSNAFSGCKNLKIVFADGTAKILDNALGGASGVVSVSIPSSVTSIGDYAFDGCTGLSEMTIPEGVTSIGRYAFSDCRGLTSITIPEGVKSIGSGVFYGCSGLAEVKMPSSVESIGDYAFHSCRNLRILFADGTTEIPGNETWNKGWLCCHVSDIDMKKISVVIPSSVTSIGKNAFKGCKDVSVVFAQGMQMIPARALGGASGVVSVTIPSSVTSIGDFAFGDCTGLSEITIPLSVTSIGRGAFSGCTGLSEMTIPSSVTSIGRGAFYGCTGLSEMTIPSSVTSIEESVFHYCIGLSEMTIPSSVTSIGEYAFSFCTGLRKITIPSSVTSIESFAFELCRNFEIVYLGTKAQWSSISKARYWAYDTGNYTVHCTDGDIAKN